MLSMDGETPQPSLTLVETETIFILSIDSSIVANDAKDLEIIKQKNERYVEVQFSLSSVGNSFFCSAMQEQTRQWYLQRSGHEHIQ